MALMLRAIIERGGARAVNGAGMCWHRLRSGAYGENKNNENMAARHGYDSAEIGKMTNEANENH